MARDVRAKSRPFPQGGVEGIDIRLVSRGGREVQIAARRIRTVGGGGFAPCLLGCDYAPVPRDRLRRGLTAPIKIDQLDAHTVEDRLDIREASFRSGPVARGVEGRARAADQAAAEGA
jgi:hypothetical protein